MGRIAAPMIGGMLTAPLLSMFVAGRLPVAAPAAFPSSASSLKETHHEAPTTGGVLGAALLAACGQVQTTSVKHRPRRSGAPPPPADGDERSRAGVAKTARNRNGKSVDAGAGTITSTTAPFRKRAGRRHHGFKAAPDSPDVKPGDKVAFDLTLKDGAGEITAITKQ